MDISGSVILVTGGEWRHRARLRRRPAEAWRGQGLPGGTRHRFAQGTAQDGDRRLVPLPLDVTDPDQVAAAASVAKDVTLLINNAGFAAFQGSISAPDIDEARREMEVNYFGTLALTRAFAPVLAASGGGGVLNMLSMLALVSLPMAATYSASKAATLSLTRSIRAELGAQGTQVVGVLAVQTDTPLGAKLPEPRMSPTEVASDALDAVQAGTERRDRRRRPIPRHPSGLHGRPEGRAGDDVHRLPKHA